MNYKQTELKSQLIKESIGDTVIYYSLVKKEGKNLTFLSNDRLLIYDSNRRIIFYNNDFSKTPFKTTVPQPKNNVFTPLETFTFSNPNATNNILVRCTVKNAKGELQTIEWNFTCDSKTLTNQWMKLLEDQKNKIIEKKTGEKNAGFIHDTLLEAIKVNKPEQPLRETILKPEEQVLKSAPPPQSNQIKNSKLSDPRRSQVGVSNVQALGVNQSNLRQTQSRMQYSRTQNIRESSAKPRESYLRPEQSIKNSEIKNPSMREVQNTRQNNSKQRQSGVDWNLKFLKNPSEATIYEFQEAAVRTFMEAWEKDSKSLDQRRVYDSQGLKVIICNSFSKEAKYLKRQFRNYHFILQACKNKVVVGVPLCTLIEWQGIIALVKASIPAESEQVRLSKVHSQIRELERYTRISNNVLDRCVLWDLTELYGLNSDKRFIYVDMLIDYLPYHVDESMLGTSLRPEYLLDTVDRVIPGGDIKGGSRQEQKNMESVCSGLNSCIKDLASFLSSQELLWVDALELKDIFHSFGVNFKLLPKVYESISNQSVRKYVQSVMVAKVAKDIVNQSIFQARKQNKKVSPEIIVQDYLRLLMEGNNNNSSEAWKELNLSFKRSFSTPISNSQIIPGIFLNSLIKLLRVKIDESKLNKTKKVFKQQGIIGQGFVRELQPKVKSYYRFTTEFIQKVRYACREEKKDENMHQEIVNDLQLKSKNIPVEYSLNNNQQAILQYLSYYTSPAQFESNSSLKHIKIYQALLQQPPSAFSLKITKSFLAWALKKDRSEQFQQIIQEALKISDYWLEEGHLYQTGLFELLSNFYASKGNTEESINYMKEALSKTIKNCGSQSKQAGSRYYELGERQLKAGNKKSALENFMKAKANMQANQSTSINYPLLLMRTASLELNNGNTDACIETALDAIKQFDEYDKRTGSPVITEGYKIKTFEILARCYEINSKKAQLKSMASICAKKFNSCQMEWTFQQMMRICLAAACFTQTYQQCKKFYNLCVDLKKQQSIEASQAMAQLMDLASSIVVIQKFLTRFDFIDRVIAERSSTKGLTQDTRDFLMISRYLVTVVGEDYIQGLIQQKQYD